MVKLASVSTRDFYEHFEGKEECFLAAFDAVRDHLEELIAEAAAAEPDWPHQVIAALRAALDFFAAEPDLARLCLLESVSATPTIAIRFREAVLACVPALARGRAELADPDSLLPETESSILGGIVSLAPARSSPARPRSCPRSSPTWSTSPSAPIWAPSAPPSWRPRPGSSNEASRPSL